MTNVNLKACADATAACTGLAAWKGWLSVIVPHTWSEAAAMMSFIWLTISILQSETVKRLTNWVMKKFGRKDNGTSERG